MLYLFYGNNIEKKKAAIDKLTASLKKEAVFSLEKINDLDFSEAKISEHIVGSSLFGEKFILILENLLEKSECEDFILRKLKEIKESENIFILNESKIKADLLKKIKTNTVKTESFEIIPLKETKFNIFSISDAFAKRDKKEAWLLFQKAIKKTAPEEIHGILFWQIKNLIMVKDYKDQEIGLKETGLNPFVYKKALSASKNFSDSDLKKMITKLSFIFQQGHSGKDISIELEKFILKEI